MPRLLIADQRQFGYHNDTYKYSQHLRGDYDVTYICWDYGFKRIEVPGVSVIYVPRQGRMIDRWARFVKRLRGELQGGGYDIAFVVYFRGCSVLRRDARKIPLILDIRTGSVRRQPVYRLLENLLLRFDLRGFPRISVISESLRSKLRLSSARARVLPVGAPMGPLPPRDFRELRLLYVGTLLGREIHKTVEGFDIALEQLGPSVSASYEIVGDGPAGDKQALLKAIAASRNRQSIRYHGRIPTAELGRFFANCNVGVAFVPLRPWYQCQPVSKVFEYLLTGMPVIATATDENKLVISGKNGVLIQDSAEEFARGVVEIYRLLPTLDPMSIQHAHRQSSWEAIIAERLSPLLREVLQQQGFPIPNQRMYA